MVGGRFKSSFAENIFSGFGLSEYFWFLYLRSFMKHLQNAAARELLNKWTFKLHWDALIQTVWEIVVFALHTVEDKRKTHCKCQSISRYILDTIYCNGHRISPATVGTEKYSEHFYSLNCLLKKTPRQNRFWQRNVKTSSWCKVTKWYSWRWWWWRWWWW